MLTDNRLKIFVALAQAGGFTEAARRLGISQPAVSQCATQLEAEAGAQLLIRGRAEVSLTPLGERFLYHALRILAEYESLGREMAGEPAAPEQVEIPVSEKLTAIVGTESGNITISFKSK